MLLSYNQLRKIVVAGYITGVPEELINGTSIDITLGDTLLLEELPIQDAGQPIIHLADREPLSSSTFKMGKNGYVIDPGEFILAHSEQLFNLPLNMSAEYKLKSSMARIGLEHLNAGWCDPGWNGSALTLELINCSRYHSIHIQPGDRIGQVVFFQHESVPVNKSYAKLGRYNGDRKVNGVKK